MSLDLAEHRAPTSARPWRMWTIDDAWVAIACTLPFIAAALGPTAADDLAYQVRAGDLMLRTHSILRSDVFTFTMHGHAWLNQQWGAAVLLALLHRAGGWSAIALARAGLVALAFGVTYVSALRRCADRRLSAQLTVAAFVVAAMFPGALAARAQVFAIPLFAASYLIVSERDEHPARIWLLPAIALVWANLHGSFFLPALLLGCAVIGDAVSARSVNLGRVAVLALCVGAAGVGPFGLEVYSYVAALPATPVVSNVIYEWRPMGPTSVSGIAFWSGTIAIAVGALRRRLELRPAELITLVVLTALAARAGRSVVWWALAMPPLVAAAVSRAPSRRRAEAGAREPAAVAIVGLLVAVSMVAGVHAGTVGRGLLTDAPAGVTRFLADRVDPEARIFDGWWGSWFEYALPDRPMFVDARAELFAPAVWAEYFDVSAARPGWAATLASWDIDVVVALPNHQGPLIAALRASDGWTEAYSDPEGIVFVRS